MKKLLLSIILFTAVSVNAQSLRDALYGGKLKSDTGTVIRKGDDLSTKIDTSTKKPEVAKVITLPARKDSASVTTTTNNSDSVLLVVANDPAVNTSVINDVTSTEETGNVTKDNNSIWKNYVDSLTSVLQTEVLSSKKVKGGTYSVLVEYVIGIDGQITVNNVSIFPESSYLTEQVRERLTLSAPQMTPLLNSYGKPRKAVRRQTITLSK